MKYSKPQIVTLWLLSFLFLFSGDYIFAQEEQERRYTYVVLWDGLEFKNNWAIATGNEKDQLYLSTKHRTQGLNSLKVSIDPKTKRDLSKGIILRREEADLNIDSAKSIILDVYNTGKPFRLVLVLYTDGLHESFPKIIESGLNKDIVFELSAINFNPPFGPENIAQRLLLIVYPETEMLDSIYFDNIRIQKYGGTELTPGLSPTASGLIAEGYTLPEPASRVLSRYSPILREQPPPTVIHESKTLVLLGTGLIGILFCHKKKGIK